MSFSGKKRKQSELSRESPKEAGRELPEAYRCLQNPATGVDNLLADIAWEAAYKGRKGRERKFNMRNQEVLRRAVPLWLTNPNFRFWFKREWYDVADKESPHAKYYKANCSEDNGDLSEESKRKCLNYLQTHLTTRMAIALLQAQKNWPEEKAFQTFQTFLYHDLNTASPEEQDRFFERLNDFKSRYPLLEQCIFAHKKGVNNYRGKCWNTSVALSNFSQFRR